MKGWGSIFAAKAFNINSSQLTEIISGFDSQYGTDWDKKISNEEIADKVMEKYTDFLIVKRTIKVNMEREDGYWTIDLNNNQDFMLSLYSRGELYFWHD